MDQTTALKIMKSGKNVFLTGSAGSGKTYVLNQYIQWLWNCHVPVALTASTGIAATHIGGITIHSRSGIGIKEELSDRDIDTIAGKSRVYKNISETEVLIIDEISMLSAQTLDNIERVVQAVKYDTRPWGGMQVIFCGDFFQLPPITRVGDTTKRFAFAACARNHAELTFCYLDTQHRQEDATFTRILEALRGGDISSESIMILENTKDTIYNGLTPVRLFTHNVDVDTINQKQVDTLPGEMVSYTAVSKGNKKVVTGMLKGMLAPEILHLKVDAQVLFVKNNPTAGYWNGTTGKVVGFDRNTQYPLVRLHSGKTIPVVPEVWTVESEDELLGSVTQLPLKLARAITIHKSQGMTLDAAEIDLSKAFTYGQAYVALSRVKDLAGLRLLGLNRSGLQAHPLVVRGDGYFKEQSQEAVNGVIDMSLSDWELLHTSFISSKGGVYTSSHVPETQKYLSKEIPKKHDTLAITADLLRQGKDIDALVQERGYTRGTILQHLTKIRLLFPEIDMSHIAPSQDLIDRVQHVVDTLALEETNWTETGTLRLAPVYHALGKEMGYDDLKWCMIFVDIP